MLTKPWVELVKAKLEELKWEDIQLAKKIGVSKGTLSKILNLKQATSPYVDPICDVLELPGPEFADALEWRAVKTLRDLRKDWPEEFESVLAKIWSAESRLRSRERKDR